MSAGAPEGGLERLHRAQCRIAAEALASILPGKQAADTVLATVLRAHPKLGARDRRWVSALVWGVLRDVHALRGGDPEASPERLVATWLAWRLGADAATLDRLGLDRVEALDAGTLSGAQRRNWPPKLDAALVAELGEADADALADALRRPAAVDLRVNTLRADREQALRALRDSGIECTVVADSRHGLRLSDRRPLSGTSAWRDGWIEPQDVGSQRVADLVAARPGETVADWCAGAGGKALAMAADMENRGRIDALDISPGRLARIEPRARRLGVRIIRTGDPAALPATSHYDAVLVDAPCSGIGTLRRQPDIALREPDIDGLVALQSQILGHAAARVRPGGRLVYATCSLLRAENEAVTAAFLAAHPHFRPDPEVEPLRLWPHMDDCDGFYALRMLRDDG